APRSRRPTWTRGAHRRKADTRAASLALPLRPRLALALVQRAGALVAEGILVDAGHPGAARLIPAARLELLFRRPLPPAREDVGVQQAVEVPHLMLQAACQQARADDGHRLAVLVEARHRRPLGAAGGEVDAGDGQA